MNNQRNDTNLNIDQGADFSIAIDLNREDFSPVDVTGYSFAATFKGSYQTANVSGNLMITVVNATSGNLVMSMTAASTANVMAGRYLYDVLMTDTSNIKTRLLEGTLTFRPRVT